MADPMTMLVLNQSQAIPITVTMTAATNWTQYIATAVIGLLSSMLIFIVLYAPVIASKIGSRTLRKISKLTKRNVVMIKHTEQALFSQSMINDQTLRDLTAVLNKMNGEPFDLILHTPGGEVFSSLSISRMLKQYPGKIRAVVPLYSMSGGSLLALSCNEIAMTKNACLGPIDPQLGNLFKYGSAKSWDHIVKYKGKKAEDQSISFAMTGMQYTKSIRNHLNKVMDFGMSTKQRTRFADFLTDGSIEHAFPLTPGDLGKFGVKVDVIENTKMLKILSKLVTSNRGEGVTYYKMKRGLFRYGKFR